MHKKDHMLLLAVVVAVLGLAVQATAAQGSFELVYQLDDDECSQLGAVTWSIASACQPQASCVKRTRIVCSEDPRAELASGALARNPFVMVSNFSDSTCSSMIYGHAVRADGKCRAMRGRGFRVSAEGDDDSVSLWGFDKATCENAIATMRVTRAMVDDCVATPSSWLQYALTGSVVIPPIDHRRMTGSTSYVTSAVNGTSAFSGSRADVVSAANTSMTIQFVATSNASLCVYDGGTGRGGSISFAFMHVCRYSYYNTGFLFHFDTSGGQIQSASNILLCLESEWNSLLNRSLALWAPCDTSSSQQVFKYDSTSQTVVAVALNLCLEFGAASSDRQIVLKRCTSSDSQMFTLCRYYGQLQRSIPSNFPLRKPRVYRETYDAMIRGAMVMFQSNLIDTLCLTRRYGDSWIYLLAECDVNNDNQWFLYDNSWRQVRDLTPYICTCMTASADLMWVYPSYCRSSPDDSQLFAFRRSTHSICTVSTNQRCLTLGEGTSIALGSEDEAVTFSIMLAKPASCIQCTSSTGSTSLYFQCITSC